MSNVVNNLGRDFHITSLHLIKKISFLSTKTPILSIQMYDIVKKTFINVGET